MCHLRRTLKRFWVVSPLVATLFATPVGAESSPAAQVQVDPQSTQAAVELGHTFSAVAGALSPTVVFIRLETRRGGPSGPPFWGSSPSATSTGTGFIVREDGYIVTNHHVIDGARRILVQLYDGQEHWADVVGSDPITDLAVLKIDARALPTAALGDSDELRVGHWVIAIGNPMGHALSFSVTAGIVSATGRALESREAHSRSVIDYIQTDAVANAGNSGGPLIDLEGRIVGVNTAIMSTTGGYQGYTLAIPANLVSPVVERLIHEGRVRRAGLGVSVEDATVEDAMAVGLDVTRGVVVQDVTLGGGSAERAGLRDGDVVVAVDGEPITSTAHLQRTVWFRSAGDTVAVTIRRDGGVQQRLHIPLQWLGGSAGERPDDPREGAVASPCTDNPLGLCLVEAASGADAGDGSGGLVVRAVQQVGPSFGKLIPQTDVITHVNGARVRSLADLDAVLSDCMAGQIVAVRTIRLRTGERGFTRVKLASRW